MRTLLLSILYMSILPACFAGVRHFGFVYEAPTSAAGSFESENWVTAKDDDQLDFRHEIEVGLTNHFQASVYFADWTWTESETRYTDAGLELIYNFTNPVTDAVGLSIYQEIRGGDDFIEWESKVIFQKNFGPLILAYNATLEAVWEGEHLLEREGEFSNAIGASYEISPRFSAGVELLHEFVFPEWRDEGIQNVFIGPNVCYRQNNWFVTVAVLAQATSTPDEADVQVRAIVGIGL
jgi:hypothetical protein